MSVDLQDKKYQPHRSAGFTLIEVLLCIAILSIIFGTVFRSFANVNRSYTNENVKAGVQQKARIGIDLMARDIRLAGLDPLASAGAGFISANTGASSIRFTADLNYDGELDDPFEDMTYTINGSSLVQTCDLGTGPVTATLMDNVSDLTFSYLDQEDNLLSAPIDANQIRTVLISLTVQRPSGLSGQVSRTYTTRVRCRNL
jgi:prepilin-type N-terminal cleavage/methylation domain-containing protein